MTRCPHVRFLRCPQTAPMLPWTSVAGGPVSARVASAPRSVVVMVVISSYIPELWGISAGPCFGPKACFFLVNSVNSKVSIESMHAMLSLVFCLSWLIS